VDFGAVNRTKHTFDGDVMLEAKPFLFGKLSGAIYDFLRANDVLEKHQHDEASNPHYDSGAWVF